MVGFLITEMLFLFLTLCDTALVPHDRDACLVTNGFPFESGWCIHTTCPLDCMSLAPSTTKICRSWHTKYWNTFIMFIGYTNVPFAVHTKTWCAWLKHFDVNPCWWWCVECAWNSHHRWFTFFMYDKSSLYHSLSFSVVACDSLTGTLHTSSLICHTF